MPPVKTYPAWRKGWTWTLIKCGATIVATIAIVSLSLLYLLRRLLDKLPGWLPEAWARWLFEWILSHLWFVGPALGAVLGLVVSFGIVVWDARAGKLKKVV